ncbi:hypothetical protein D0N43_22010 [Klebsiella aerogenes]|uniref:Uncharacterized protein n=1 Tax=Klebsiella aerogenes (strain ATCC 13048 / DSM 30053 / CCUG 1429 / JCM 1235 / KCTC 2190 / NBRC 13534 / NCIMB 10102 / NCTC 10006 / CDC 819-56) TaxID=1028307 RepID=A0A0H3FTM1_KLEAK|nr:hypothetical protein EAE_21000 [Klebsiella aerogenes KCTC 2190]QEU21903.1 hypothetical protein FOB49_05430 [Klebsiella aerogenes]RFP71613.1 hypothetical protein D0N43_22010 [Klebsiella aerogenes]
MPGLLQAVLRDIEVTVTKCELATALQEYLAPLEFRPADVDVIAE